MKKGRTMIGFMNSKTYDISSQAETIGAIGLGVSAFALLVSSVLRECGTKWYEPQNDASEESVRKTHDVIKRTLVSEK